MKNNYSSDSFYKAKAYAFLLLKYRLRTEKELSLRLKQKAFDEQTIAHTLSFLKEKQFIDDTCFAKSWIDSRLKKHKGLRRLVAELKIKGIDQAIIKDEIEKVKRQYNETEVVTRIIQERLAKAKNVSIETAKRRIYGYLMRQGFSPEVVNELIHQI